MDFAASSYTPTVFKLVNLYSNPKLSYKRRKNPEVKSLRRPVPASYYAGTDDTHGVPGVLMSMYSCTRQPCRTRHTSLTATGTRICAHALFRGSQAGESTSLLAL